MKWIKRLWILIILVPLLWVGWALFITNYSFVEWQERSAIEIKNTPELSEAVLEFVENSSHYVGLNAKLLIAQGDRIVLEKSFGSKNIALEPLQNHMPSQLASISKSITATAFFRLVDLKKINLDDSVCRFVKELCHSPYKEITMAHLLSHRSGLPPSGPGFFGDWLAGLRDLFRQDHRPSSDEIINLVLKTNLKFKPGSDYLYSNFAYQLLSIIIERAYGLNFEAALNELVFKPLELKNTGHYGGAIPHHHAEGLMVSSPFWSEHPDFEKSGVIGLKLSPAYFLGAGAMYSTPQDLWKWIRALKKPRFLSSQHYKNIINPVSNNYSYGFIVEENPERFIGHNGKWFGYWNELFYFLDSDLTIILLSNSDLMMADEEMISKNFLRLIYQRPYRIAIKRRSIF